MSIKDDLEEQIEKRIFSKTLNTLIERTGKTYREIARENDIPEASFFDMRLGTRTYNYNRLKRLASYFSYQLNDKSITYEYLCFGNDETRQSLYDKIDEIKEELERERLEFSRRELELKSQLDLFKEK